MKQHGVSRRNRRRWAVVAVVALWTIACGALMAALAGPARCEAAPMEARWADCVIYSVYPSIFSPQGDLPGVSAQLKRLSRLGVNVIWLMPVTPIGHPVGGHPAFNSPYCVQNYYAVNPKYGTNADLKALVARAHRLHMKVLLDEVLNHTAWENPLIEKHPEYYVHSDGNPRNPLSIKQAFNFSDVAQLDYANRDLWRFMHNMLAYWITAYHVDGFRFDTANDPDGPNRMIPAAFWQDLGRHLRQVKPDVLMLGECETPDLAEKPFQIDYGWNMYGALKSASTGGSAQGVRDAWVKQTRDYPPGMLHMAIQDDWDEPRDVNTFGGRSGALAAAVFNFTIYGVPLVYNGMEIGNAAEAVNPHAPINWQAGDPKFTAFYERLIALRRSSPALRQGTMRWLDNTAPAQVVSYIRQSGGEEILVLVNLSSSPAQGEVQGLSASGWSAVDIVGRGRDPLPRFTLAPKGFAINKNGM